MTKKIKRIRIKGGELKQKAGITAISNQTPYVQPDLEEKLTARFIAALDKGCSDLQLLTPDREAYPAFLAQLPKTPPERIDNLALARKVRAQGLNAAFKGTLLEVARDQEDRGWFWFRNTHYYIRVRLRGVLYDAETGAKMMDESLEHKVEMDDLIEVDELTGETRAEFDLALYPEVNNIVLEAVDLMGEAACEAFAEEPWTGFISSLSEGKVAISAGYTSGLTPGKVLYTRHNTEIMKGLGGQRFYLPGPINGKIEVTAVGPDASQAVILEDNGIKAGDTVKEE